MRRAYLFLVALAITYALFAPRTWLPRQPRENPADVAQLMPHGMEPLSAIIVRGVIIMTALWSLQARDNMRPGEI
ncbi:MAG TPA: hypothetical protein VFG20_14335 [Planctomycetaceae bacterium]|nr:hypothetical protein [Planctomycetaceae bacterium]